mgnify:CR=1 FL=1
MHRGPSNSDLGSTYALQHRFLQQGEVAALALAEFESFDTKAAAKRNLRAAIERVSARLGNTPAICRKS